MKPDNLKNGKEQFEHFTDNLTKKKLVQYDYRHTNGKLFSTVAKSLEYARAKRDSWLRSMAMETA